MTFRDNAPRLPQTVSLRGEGQSPTFTVSSSLLHFGNVHGNVASAAQTLTVTNTSSGSLTFGFLGDLAACEVHAVRCQTQKRWAA